MCENLQSQSKNLSTLKWNNGLALPNDKMASDIIFGNTDLDVGIGTLQCVSLSSAVSTVLYCFATVPVNIISTNGDGANKVVVNVYKFCCASCCFCFAAASIIFLNILSSKSSCS